MEKRPSVRVAGRAAPLDREEVAAAMARARLRHGQLPILAPPAILAPVLRQGEQLVALRRNASWGPIETTAPEDMLPADVFLTTGRLLIVGEAALWIELRDVLEVGLTGTCLLLALRKGIGIRLQVESPRIFRVSLAAARFGTRKRRPVPVR